MPFEDYRINGGLSASQIIIYGHNMRNGAMFGKLKTIRIILSGIIPVMMYYIYIQAMLSRNIRYSVVI